MSITIKDLIIKAVQNPENVNDDGTVNWNFVDADIHLDNAEQHLGFTSEQLFSTLESYNALRSHC
jgi:hypothetical protein